MDAVTKRQVPIRLTLDIKLVRIAELCRVPVGRSRPCQHDLISRNMLPSQFDIASGLTEEKPDWRQVAQCLFYRLWHQGGLALEAFHRIWVIRKAHHGIRDQVLGRPIVLTFAMTSGTVASIK